ncbi:MAG: hypothetical protein KatS3mg113_0728 [Planctomycetaceae bacterium]|nr:MAG: hypothetical protein KatS3mg113_0728 [Planctomycetaceae bacterium]
MSARGSNEGPAPDIYVGLLFASLFALTLAIVFLILELNKYEWKIAP